MANQPISPEPRQHKTLTMVNHYIRADGTAVLLLPSTFDFSTLMEVQRAFALILGECSAGIRLDFRLVDYMDSAALGLLLVFREKAGHCHKPLSFVNVSDSAKRMLEIANFDKVFQLAA